ncbi:hypothetical protein DFQ27_002368 [Actinomortierella ambigua]|uniref:F-box domain-containing protein n=1 Tax=Actinomortierella ambigua TaxID=1343610 RepID=A0A9P6U6A6_9FUNG|nr:hypothetical protein DFQ27_002368 [Actinomortierella ambigua]
MPEILQALGGHVHRADMASCARVSKLWHHTFIPFLYQIIQSGMVQRGLVLTPAHARYVRQLEVEVDGSSTCSGRLFVELLSDLRALRWHLVWHEHVDSLRQVVVGNPSLQSIVVHWGQGGARVEAEANQWRTVGTFVRVVADAACGPTLRELVLEDPLHRMDPPSLLDVLRRLPALEVLKCRAGMAEVPDIMSFVEEQRRCAREYDRRQQVQQQQQQQQPLPGNRGIVFKLRSLELLELHVIRAAIQLLPVLPELEQLRVQVELGFSVDQFPMTPPLAELCPKLRVFQMVHPMSFSMSPMAINHPHLANNNNNNNINNNWQQQQDVRMLLQEDIVARGLAEMRAQSVEHVVLSEAYTGGRSVGSLLRRHFVSLQVVKLWYCRSTVTSMQIQALLTQCPALRELSFLGPIFKSGVTLKDAVREPWACTGLERLEMAVQGVCRIDDHTNEEEDVEDKDKEKCGLAQGQPPQQHPDHCRALEEQLYRQLGKLVQLRTLVLGAVSAVDDRGRLQRDCLGWSLDRGLGGMAPPAPSSSSSSSSSSFPSSSWQKCGLEVLDLKRCAHEMSLIEVQWMQRNFPRLRYLRGVLGSSTMHRDQHNEIRRWVDHHWPSIRLS